MDRPLNKTYFRFQLFHYPHLHHFLVFYNVLVFQQYLKENKVSQSKIKLRLLYLRKLLVTCEVLFKYYLKVGLNPSS